VGEERGMKGGEWADVYSGGSGGVLVRLII